MKIFLFLFLTLFPVVSGVSSACLNEFGAIYSGGLDAKAEELSSDLDFDESNCSGSYFAGGTYSCNFDFSTVYDAIVPLCEEVRGSCA